MVYKYNNIHDAYRYEHPINMHITINMHGEHVHEHPHVYWRVWGESQRQASRILATKTIIYKIDIII